ncbi:MAG TPA: hypothetical protein VFT79_02595 [Solirubrobacterales bacterium]|nr:hypothetical protein [Solirubrobacterales bacterium]
MIALLVVLIALLLAAPAGAETVGSDLEALTPTKTVSCAEGSSCVVAQALGGNGTPFSPPGGIVTSWSVRLGGSVPEGMRLVVQDPHAYGGAFAGRRAIDLGSPQRGFRRNGVSTFSEQLPIQGDQTFGLQISGASRQATRATLLAPYTDEYDTALLWDPAPVFGGTAEMATKVLENSRLTLSIEVMPPSPQRCAPLNTFTGSNRRDDYGGFHQGGDVIRGRGGSDALRGYGGEDCMYGGRGQDAIAGMDGSDLIVGGPGRDDIGAGDGDDRIRVRDGARDVVRCGDGHDVVKADRLDRLFDC